MELKDCFQDVIIIDNIQFDIKEEFEKR